MHEIHRSYGTKTVLRGLSFEVARGEVFGLLGPNGAGKTTTLRMITGILLPDAGEVEIFGLSPIGPARRRVGYLPEERGLYPTMALLPCLVYLAELHGIPPVEGRRRAADLLERLGLASEHKTKIRDLSAGMAQKAMMVATLLHRPELLVLDEPFFRLDPVNRRLILDIIEEARAAGAAVVLSTHQMAEAERLCGSVLLLHHGVDVCSGTVNEVRLSAGVAMGSIRFEGDLPASLPGTSNLRVEGRDATFEMEEGATTSPILAALLAAGVEVLSFDVSPPSLDEIFVRTVGGSL